MKLKKKFKLTIPPSIELLFDNEQLENAKTLCLLYAFYLQSKKKFNKLSDIVFYYSLINFGLIQLFNPEKKEQDKVSPNLYLRYQKKVNNILLVLSNLNYIEIKGDISYKTLDLGIRLTKHGANFMAEMKLEYFIKLTNEYISALNQIESTSVNKSKLSEGYH